MRGAAKLSKPRGQKGFARLGLRRRCVQRKLGIGATCPSQQHAQRAATKTIPSYCTIRTTIQNPPLSTPPLTNRPRKQNNIRSALHSAPLHNADVKPADRLAGLAALRMGLRISSWALEGAFTRWPSSSANRVAGAPDSQCGCRPPHGVR
jgi:hypothetical protein